MLPVTPFSNQVSELPRLEEDHFHFACRPDLSCFNRCCSDVNIVLSPFDIVRMKSSLQIDSTEFLDRYCVIPFHAQQIFPVVFLKMREEAKSCPFVTDSGCSIYDARPWACRMYPLGDASRAGGDERFSFLIREEFCCGHLQDTRWSVEQWKTGQGIDPYDQAGEEFKSIALHPFFQGGGSLKPGQMEMLFMVLYDVDRFRRFVFESSFLTRFTLQQSLTEELRQDDEALLRFGYRWLRFCLFGERVSPFVETVRNVSKSAKAGG